MLVILAIMIMPVAQAVTGRLSLVILEYAAPAEYCKWLVHFTLTSNPAVSWGRLGFVVEDKGEQGLVPLSESLYSPSHGPIQ